MDTEKSSEHTDTGITDTASEVDDFMKSTESPSASLDSRPTPGQRAGGKSSSNDIMDVEITHFIAAQNGNLKNQSEEPLPPPIHPECGTKRDRKEIQSTEEDSDCGKVKKSEPDAKSYSNRFRKKLREGNGEQPEKNSDKQS